MLRLQSEKIYEKEISRLIFVDMPVSQQYSVKKCIIEQG